MANITHIQQFKKQQLKKKAKANTLCLSGFHKWEIIHHNQFDVKQGKLVTTMRCIHCKKSKVQSQ